MTKPNSAEPQSESGLTGACQNFVRTRSSVPSHNESDDLAQDVVVRALQSGATVREPVRYLLRIARNLFIDRRRSQKREKTMLELVASSEPASDRIHPERVLSGKQELRIVLRAIEALPPRCREAFALHRFEMMSYAAIARRMGVSTSMVEKHIAEAMRRIARTLKEPEERT
ncbi:MAG TPA: RNA polymerase sigma factor [Micropepsaceae bacterium]|nr:RNA polymerase sigma factor [Micropepsaceae bacterium]